MPTINLEEVVGEPVRAEAAVMTADARARLKARQVGPPLGLLVKKLNARRQARAKQEGVDNGPSSGPDACALAVTDTELVAVQTVPGWRWGRATAVIERVPRTSITGAKVTAGARAAMTIGFADGRQWVFEVRQGVPRKKCEHVVSALGF
jgi:hypothetical protein